MQRLRHVLVAAWLALALVAGQQLVVLHALGHASDRISNKDKDGTATCKVHFACSQLASVVSAKATPAVPLTAATHALPQSRERSQRVATFFAFLSRGPPGAPV